MERGELCRLERKEEEGESGSRNHTLDISPRTLQSKGHTTQMCFSHYPVWESGGEGRQGVSVHFYMLVKPNIH